MTASQAEPVLVEVDQRRRVSLGKIGHTNHSRYLATVEPDGTIIFRPAVVMTEIEARFLQNKDLVNKIRTQRQNPAAYVPRPR